MDAKTLGYMEARVNACKKLSRRIKLLNDNIAKFLEDDNNLSLCLNNGEGRLSLVNEFDPDEIFNFLSKDIVVGLEKQRDILQKEFDEL